MTSPTRVLNISNVVLTNKEVSLLCKGMSFCPTPKPNLYEFSEDLFKFTRLLRLKYHFHGESFEDSSIVKLPSTYCPPVYENRELEEVIDSIKYLQTSTIKPTDNIKNLRVALESVTDKVTKNEIIVKSADKGDVTVIMSTEYYVDMCMRELSNTEYYTIVGESDPTPTIMEAVSSFALRYKSMLTPKEYEFLTKRKYSMANFYMLPKLHKSSFLNDIMGSSEYIHLKDFNHTIDGRPIVGGPSFYTSGMSQMIDIILQPLVKMIPYILKDSFDLLERYKDNRVQDNVRLGTCDIKSLYTNISKDLALKSLDYWITKHGSDVPLLQRLNKNFVLNALNIILEFNYFFFNDFFVKQIKGFAMGTKAAVTCANLTVGYLEVQMFVLLPTIYPMDVVDFIIRNYFRFLDDICHQWMEEFDIKYFYQIFDGLDQDLKFIFSNLSSESNFMDVHFKIVDNQLEMDIYKKPTDSYNYLNYHSSHPKHTRDNIALSLAKRIVRIVSGDREKRLDELKQHLIMRDYPVSVINRSFLKVFQPKREEKSDILVCTTTYNPCHLYNQDVIRKCLKNPKTDRFAEVFEDFKVVLGTRQPRSLRSFVTKSRFSLNAPLGSTREVGLFHCPGVCKYHRLGYFEECKSFRFGQRQEHEWKYTRPFDCNSRNVIYILICGGCWKFYIGETQDTKERARLHASNTNHPKNANCKKLSEHLHSCSGLQHPYFKMFPMYYVENPMERKFIEKRFIKRFNPPLNSDN